jgi:hypothetical protein
MKRKNMKRTVTVLALLMSLALAMPLSAKTADSTYVMPQHSAFVEVGGVTGLVGLNYDMRLRKGSHWGFRVGASYAYDSEYNISSTDTYEHFIGFHTEINYLIGGRRNHLELGLGNKLWMIKYKLDGSYYTPSYSESYASASDNSGEQSANVSYRKTWVRDFVYLNVGYRHEALHGFQFRCGVTPMIHVTNDWLWADGSTCNKGSFLFAPYASFGWAF